MKSSNVMHKISIDPNGYANIETGELLGSELPIGSRLNMQEPTTQATIKFKNFVASDAAIEEHILSVLLPKDYRRYRLMACWLHKELNMVLNGNHKPHNLQSLAKALDITVDETTRLINRLTSFGLAKWATFSDYEFFGKVLVFNPYVIKKRTRFEKQLLQLFPTFQEYTKKAALPPKKRVSKKCQPEAELKEFACSPTMH
ncbi:hypothetical protein [Paracnuella aquatica]|uniref:hypothetical protein n=1 Tax=Paracnuella aquatica TaxID=2268757 RepID=UPI000F4FEF5B|nr:hypothetical protein [Paracnuella aquatica]RPD51147.1 hypothetical protein DRJ53_00240 [Paracnuella aquatica]